MKTWICRGNDPKKGKGKFSTHAKCTKCHLEPSNVFFPYLIPDYWMEWRNLERRLGTSDQIIDNRNRILIKRLLSRKRDSLWNLLRICSWSRLPTQQASQSQKRQRGRCVEISKPKYSRIDNNLQTLKEVCQYSCCRNLNRMNSNHKGWRKDGSGGSACTWSNDLLELEPFAPDTLFLWISYKYCLIGRKHGPPLVPWFARGKATNGHGQHSITLESLRKHRTV